MTDAKKSLSLIDVFENTFKTTMCFHYGNHRKARKPENNALHKDGPQKADQKTGTETSVRCNLTKCMACQRVAWTSNWYGLELAGLHPELEPAELKHESN